MNISLYEDRYASIQNLIEDINIHKHILSKYINYADLLYLLNETANSDKRAINSYTKRLLANMLKCKYQPSEFNRIWVNMIIDSQDGLSGICTESKSLYSYYIANFDKNYKSAINYAHSEIRLDTSEFPTTCEWDKDDILNEEFISKFID